jgi:hypothetical protein
VKNGAFLRTGDCSLRQAAFGELDYDLFIVLFRPISIVTVTSTASSSKLAVTAHLAPLLEIVIAERSERSGQYWGDSNGTRRGTA